MNKDHVTNTLYWLRGYANRIDESHDFSQNAMLYYRKTKSEKYIVINHFNRKGKVEIQGFDSWLCEYAGNDEPGLGAPIKITPIKLGLKLPEDQKLINEVL